MFGAANVGKSFLLIDLACHIAAGMNWRNCITKKSTVLYIAGEGLSGLAGRFKAWTLRHGEIPDLLFVRPFPVGLTSAGAAAALAERMSGLPEKPRLVILDTLAANFGPGNENDAKDMAAALDGLRTLGGDWLVLCAHHTGHSDKERSRGHSSLFAALDVEICVSRPDPAGPIKVSHTKCRDMERMEPLFFDLDPEKLPWADEDGDPINSLVLAPRNAGEPGADQSEKPLAGKTAKALEILQSMIERQTANLGGYGTPRVALRDWYDALAEIEPDKGHRSRIRVTLEHKGKIFTENGYVYVC